MKKKFTLLTVAALSVVALTACSTTTSSKKDVAESSSSIASSSSASSAQQSTEDKTYKMGDKVVFDGNMEITITGAEWTDERNQFDDSNPEKVLKVTYNVTNLSDKDHVIGSDIDVYVGGKKMETYPNDNTFETISSGRSYEGAVEHFGVNGTGAIELEVKPSFAFNTKPAIVKLDLQ